MELDLNEFTQAEYQNKARGNGAYDCWGLVKEIYKRLGVKLKDLNEAYDKESFSKQCYKEMSKDWKKVEQPRKFDLVTIKNLAGIVDHAGVMVDRFNFIQATRHGVIITRINKTWKKVIEGFYRYAGNLHTS